MTARENDFSYNQNVVSLADQRDLRAQRLEAQAISVEADTADNDTDLKVVSQDCPGGVCTIQWKPKRPAA